MLMHYSILILFVAMSTLCGCFATATGSVDVEANVKTSSGNPTDAIPSEFVAKASPEFENGEIPDELKETIKSITDSVPNIEKYSFENASRTINFHIKSLWEKVKKATTDYTAVLSFYEENKEYIQNATRDETQSTNMVNEAEEKLKRATISRTEAEKKIKSIKKAAENVKRNCAKIKETEKSIPLKKQEAQTKNETIEGEMKKIKESVKEFNEKLNPCPGKKNEHERVRDAIMASVKKAEYAAKEMPTLSGDEKAKRNEVQSAYEEIKNSVRQIKNLLDEMDVIVTKEGNIAQPQKDKTQPTLQQKGTNSLEVSAPQTPQKEPKINSENNSLSTSQQNVAKPADTHPPRNETPRTEDEMSMKKTKTTTKENEKEITELSNKRNDKISEKDITTNPDNSISHTYFTCFVLPILIIVFTNVFSFIN